MKRGCPERGAGDSHTVINWNKTMKLGDTLPADLEHGHRFSRTARLWLTVKKERKKERRRRRRRRKLI